MVRDDTISCCTLVGIRAIAIFIEAEWSSDNTVACIQVRYCFNNIQATIRVVTRFWWRRIERYLLIF